MVAPNLRPIYLLGCKTRYHLGPFHGDVRKVSHYFGLNVSKVLFKPSSYVLISELRVNHTCTHAF